MLLSGPLGEGSFVDAVEMAEVSAERQLEKGNPFALPGHEKCHENESVDAKQAVDNAQPVLPLRNRAASCVIRPQEGGEA